MLVRTAAVPLWPPVPLNTQRFKPDHCSALLVFKAPRQAMSDFTAPTFSRWPPPRRSSLCRCCGCCGFAANCCSCCCLAKMGVSRAHESAPRSLSLVHGTDPCTTEDHPLSVFAIALSLLIIKCFVTVLFLPRAFNAARPNILFSFISLSFAALPSRSPISFCAQNNCSKKIGKRRAPAEQVARQTPQPNFDTTRLASPEVNTMGRRLNAASQSAK